MPDRDLARQLIADVSSHDLYAQFRVDLSQHKLVITGKLTSELAERIRTHKPDLISYLTTPPDIIGICRNKHRVRWQCTPYGLWVCACYFEEPVNQKPVARISQMRDYWQKERAL